jgi:Putative Actinobacterial Holin-X, holin superfamily III
MTESSPTESPRTPQAGIADALSDLTEQTRNLVRREVEAAQREMFGKAKASVPVAGLLAATGVLGLLAAASSYRLGLRLLEKVLPPATAALVATVAYGGGAGFAAVVAVRKIHKLPPPFPTETAKDASAVIGDAAAEVGDRASGPTRS